MHEAAKMLRITNHVICVVVGRWDAENHVICMVLGSWDAQNRAMGGGATERRPKVNGTLRKVNARLSVQIGPPRG